ncbi:MAG: class I SAM-dependent methyltransferase [Bacteroidia bacterium]|nr:class I SAM-dependent methyltransferase [Bacteroidia bacterium]
MNKFKKLIKAIGLLLKQPSLINLIVEYDENYHTLVTRKYGIETGLKKINFDEFLQLEDTLDQYSFLDGGSIVTDYLLLKALSKKLNRPDCFEIGTWRGESALSMAKYANKVFTLNLSKEELLSLGFSEEYANLQGVLCNRADNITQLWGNTFTYDFSPYKNKFDLIFVDGDHKYKSVVNDTKIAVQIMKNKNSVIVWHDYGFGTETTRWEVLLGILEGLPKEMHRHLYSVNNTLCAIYYPFPVESKLMSYPQSPDKLYKIKISKE